MALGIFASCVPYPEENPDPIPPVSSMFLKKTITTFVTGATLETEFTYAGSKIVKEESSDGSKTIFTYNDQDLITKLEDFQGTELQEVKTYVYDISDNLINMTSIQMPSMQGTKWVYVHNADGTISYQKFTGDDVSQTNLVATGLISSTKLVETITDPVTTEVTTNTILYTYDNRNHPWINITGFDKIYFADSDWALNNLNNVLTESDQLNDEEPVLRFTNDYEYTNNNFPYKSNTSQNNVITATTNYFY